MPLELWIPAAIAILLVGMSKGGVAGMTMVSVPIMSMSYPPLEAAAIVLPVLIAMDVFAVHRYRKDYDKTTLAIVLPGALLGILVGTLTFRALPDEVIRFGVGAMATFFGIYYWRGWGEKLNFGGSRPWGWFWGAVSGFTSFGIHAGGPPIKIYLLQQGFNRFVLSGTSAFYFGLVNAMKIPPYLLLGYFNSSSLAVSVWLLPLAPVGVYVGAYIVKRVSDQTIYTISYIAMMLVGIRLMLLSIGI